MAIDLKVPELSHDEMNVVAYLRENLTRIAELFFVNGCEFNIQGLGVRGQGGLYGRMGLTPAEAIEFAYHRGRMDGIMDKTDPVHTTTHGQAIMAMFHEEFTRMKEHGSKVPIAIVTGVEAEAILKSRPEFPGRKGK